MRRRVVQFVHTVKFKMVALLAIGQLVAIAPQPASAQTKVQVLNALSVDFANRYEKEHAAAIVWAASNNYGPLRVEEAG